MFDPSQEDLEKVYTFILNLAQLGASLVTKIN